MKYCVNDGCIGCGLSASACPEVFSLTEESSVSKHSSLETEPREYTISGASPAGALSSTKAQVSAVNR